MPFARIHVLAALVGVSALLGGCNAMAFPAYVLAGAAPAKTQKAEFDGLRGQTVAIVVYCGLDVSYEFRNIDIRWDLGMVLREEMVKNVKDCRIADPLRVARYQDQNTHWDTSPMPQIGRDLQADYVLYVSLLEFTTREPGSTNLARGRIEAQLSLWNTHPDKGTDGCVWRKENVSVIYPKEGPIPATAADVGPLRIATERLFADLVAKNFYDYKLPKED